MASDVEKASPDLQQIVAEADTGGRKPTGLAAAILFTVALGCALFQLWYASPLPFMLGFGVLNDTEARSIHLAFALFLAFTAFPGIIASARQFPLFAIFFVIGGVGAGFAGIVAQERK